MSQRSTTEVAVPLDRSVGEREKRRRDREAERRSLGEHLTGLLRVDGFQRFTSQKDVFRPTGWGKLAISFRCERLDPMAARRPRLT